MISYEEAYQRVRDALDACLLSLSRGIPQPVLVPTPTGRAFRYQEKSPQQALIIKCVRMLSALTALKVLLDHGLLLDAGSMMRISDEVGSDIMFIAGPMLFAHPPEERHRRYLEELFQEEFGGADILSSRLKRNRVSRREIRAYVARTYSDESEVSRAVAVTELIEGVFSGFVHGAGTHTMDLFDGLDFQVTLDRGNRVLADMRDQFSHYLQRTVQGFCFSAMAIGREDVFRTLHRLDKELFQANGELR